MDKFLHKWIVRTKPIMKWEDTRSAFGSKVQIPDTKYCTKPIYIKAITEGIVYCNWHNYADTISKTEILCPTYIDENWVAIDTKFYKLPDISTADAEV